MAVQPNGPDNGQPVPSATKTAELLPQQVELAPPADEAHLPVPSGQQPQATPGASIKLAKAGSQIPAAKPDGKIAEPGVRPVGEDARFAEKSNPNPSAKATPKGDHRQQTVQQGTDRKIAETIDPATGLPPLVISPALTLGAVAVAENVTGNNPSQKRAETVKPGPDGKVAQTKTVDPATGALVAAADATFVATVGFGAATMVAADAEVITTGMKGATHTSTGTKTTTAPEFNAAPLKMEGPVQGPTGIATKDQIQPVRTTTSLSVGAPPAPSSPLQPTMTVDPNLAMRQEQSVGLANMLKIDPIKNPAAYKNFMATLDKMSPESFAAFNTVMQAQYAPVQNSVGNLGQAAQRTAFKNATNAASMTAHNFTEGTKVATSLSLVKEQIDQDRNPGANLTASASANNQPKPNNDFAGGAPNKPNHTAQLGKPNPFNKNTAVNDGNGQPSLGDKKQFTETLPVSRHGVMVRSFTLNANGQRVKTESIEERNPHHKASFGAYARIEGQRNRALLNHHMAPPLAGANQGPAPSAAPMIGNPVLAAQGPVKMLTAHM